MIPLEANSEEFRAQYAALLKLARFAALVLGNPPLVWSVEAVLSGISIEDGPGNRVISPDVAEVLDSIKDVPATETDHQRDGGVALNKEK